MNATTPINATPTNRINGMGNSPIVESDGSSFAALTYTWVDHQVNTTTTTFPHSDLSFCLQVVVFLHSAGYVIQRLSTVNKATTITWE